MADLPSLPPVDGGRIDPDPRRKLPPRQTHSEARLPGPGGEAVGRLPGRVAKELIDRGQAVDLRSVRFRSHPIGTAPPGGKGYKYKGEDLGADGVFQIQLKGGATKIIVKGKGPNLPLPIASSFIGATSVTLQLRGDDVAQCFSVKLTNIKKQETDSFKIK